MLNDSQKIFGYSQKLVTNFRHFLDQIFVSQFLSFLEIPEILLEYFSQTSSEILRTQVTIFFWIFWESE